MDRTDGPLVGLLREIVRDVAITEVAAHPPDVRLCLGDEALEGPSVAVLGRHEQPGQVIHRRASVAGREPNRTCVDHSRVNDDGEPSVEPMRCDDVREILSAALDGEAGADEIVRSRRPRRHLRRRARRTQAGSPSSSGPSVSGAPSRYPTSSRRSSPGRGRPASDAAGGCGRRWRGWRSSCWRRASPALILGEAAGADTHLARHIGAFGAALAIGFAYVGVEAASGVRVVAVHRRARRNDGRRARSPTPPPGAVKCSARRCTSSRSPGCSCCG